MMTHKIANHQNIAQTHQAIACITIGSMFHVNNTPDASNAKSIMFGKKIK